MRYASLISGALLVGAFGTAGCAHHQTESRIRSVEARIDGITCPTCVPPLTASLKRQYQQSAVEVDDDKDTATVHFDEKDSFSAADFRAAVERVRMRVVTVRAQACGTVDAADGKQWLTAGTNRFLVQSDRTMPLKEALCVDGTLDTHSDPVVFQVSAFSFQRGS